MPSKRASSKKGNDAISMLKADHDKVKKMFKDFERMHEAEEDQEAEQLAKQICNELTLHAQVEEELFYPAVREAISDDDLMDEADIEHASAKELVAQLEELEPGDDHYDARVTVLSEYIEHHTKEEEGQMFVQARKADVNTVELGKRIAERKEELRGELGIEEDDQAASPSARSESTQLREKRK